jgi:K+-transporting ATPase, c chain
VGWLYRPSSAAALLRRNLTTYGFQRVIVPFIGIKAIDRAVLPEPCLLTRLVEAGTDAPVDAVTASRSGLDPAIIPQAALAQADRITVARGAGPRGHPRAARGAGSGANLRAL